jgi:Spy/CpxP family protein refolding chaperone
MTRPVYGARAVFVGLAALTIVSTTVSAQRGGGGGARGPAGVSQVETRSRMQILTDVLTLDNDQKKQVKAAMDAAYKEAAPVRAQLTKTRAALAAAIQSKDQAQIDAAAKSYGAQATAMTEIEMKALAQILGAVKPEQKTQGTAPTFYLMRGAFLDDKKWDEIPEIKGY